MKRLLAAASGLAAMAALAAGCSSTSGSTSAASSAPAPSSGTAASLKTADSPDGRILVDGTGRALYLFEADTGPSSTCTGACAAAWPPDTTTGRPAAAAGLTASDLGTSVRADKSTQVTYHGHPLYYFAHDTKAGDVNGQGVTAFGGAWYLVGPDGTAVTATASAPPSSSGGY